MAWNSRARKHYLSRLEEVGTREDRRADAQREARPLGFRAPQSQPLRERQFGPQAVPSDLFDWWGHEA